MTNYTKDQIENGTLSAKEILDSWTSGQGSTHAMMHRFDHVKDGAINNIPVNTNLLTAIAEMFVVKSKPSESFYEALRAGYLSKNHLDEYKDAKAVAKPLEGHVMTSAQWLQSCIDKLPPIPAPDYEGHAALIDTISDSMTKAQILEIVHQAKALVNVKVYTIDDCTPEQQDKFHDLLNKERAIASASLALSVYLNNVQPVAKRDDSLQGEYDVYSGTMPSFKQLVTEEKWTLGEPKALNGGETILFTIKVI